MENNDEPIAWVDIVPVRGGYIAQVKNCPYCGKTHRHGAGEDGKNLGWRGAHCIGVDHGDYELRLRPNDSR